MPTVKVWEAAALSLNIDPTEVRTNPQGWMGGSAFIESADFEDRLEVISRNVDVNGAALLRQDASPVPTTSALISLPEFAAWAVAVRWEIPSELAALAPAPKSAVRKDELGTRERETLLKILFCVARDAYGYTPGKRSTAPADMAKACEKFGLPVSDDTARKYLNEAESLFGKG